MRLRQAYSLSRNGTNQEEDGEGDEDGDGEGDLVVRQVEDEGREEGNQEAGNDQVTCEEERLPS